MKPGWSGVVAAAALLLLVLMPAQARPKVTSSVALARAEFEATQAELARVFKKCITAPAGMAASVGALRDSQRLWTVYRDLNARAFQYGETGRIPKDDQFYLTAKTIITLSRIKELRALFDCN